VFGAVLLVYLVYVVAAISQNARGAGAVAGYAILAAFAVTWFVTVAPQVTEWGPRRFWTLYGILAVLFLAELPFARIAGFVLCVYITIITVARLGLRAAPVVLALAVGAAVIPPAIPSWHDSVSAAFAAVTPVAIPVAALAMYGSTQVVNSYRALAEARAELARLAASSVEIVDDGVGGPAGTGSGLAGLRERVAAAGGVIEAGPVQPAGWRLRASLAPGVGA
jgi:signal transduction histidine kinase